MVRVGRGVDARDALAAADEVEQRGTARVGRGLVVRIVEEAARRAVEEDRVACFRFPAVMSDASYVVVAVHAPVFCPSLPSLRRERDGGVDEAARAAETRHLLASPVWRSPCSGSAAIILSTSDWQATRGLALSAARVSRRSRWPARGRVGRDDLVEAVGDPGGRQEPASLSTQSPNHLSNAPVNSSRLTAPSLFASVALKRAGDAAAASAAAASTGLWRGLRREMYQRPGQQRCRGGREGQRRA